MENARRGSEIPDYPIFLVNLRIGTLVSFGPDLSASGDLMVHAAT